MKNREMPNGRIIENLLLPESYRFYREFITRFKNKVHLIRNEARYLDECFKAISVYYPDALDGKAIPIEQRKLKGDLTDIPKDKFKVMVEIRDKFREEYKISILTA